MRKDSMLVTVAMPTYNGERYVREAIEGVLGQTCGDFELLVVDDCSKDATREIAASFADPRIRVVKNDGRLGVYKNFNRCLTLAQGKYVFFNHQDDIMLPELLERAVPILEKDPDIACVGVNPLVIDADGIRGAPFFTWAEQNTVFSGESFLDAFFLQYTMAISSVFLRKDMLKANNLRFSLKDGESADMVFWVRLALRAKKLFFLNEHLFLRRRHAGQCSVAFHGAEYEQKFILETLANIFLSIAESSYAIEKKRDYCRKTLAAVNSNLLEMPRSGAATVEKKFRKKIRAAVASLNITLGDTLLDFVAPS